MKVYKKKTGDIPMISGALLSLAHPCVSGTMLNVIMYRLLLVLSCSELFLPWLWEPSQGSIPLTPAGLFRNKWQGAQWGQSFPQCWSSPSVYCTPSSHPSPPSSAGELGALHSPPLLSAMHAPHQLPRTLPAQKRLPQLYFRHPTSVSQTQW